MYQIICAAIKSSIRSGIYQIRYQIRHLSNRTREAGQRIPLPVPKQPLGSSCCLLSDVVLSFLFPYANRPTYPPFPPRTPRRCLDRLFFWRPTLEPVTCLWERPRPSQVGKWPPFSRIPSERSISCVVHPTCDPRPRRWPWSAPVLFRLSLIVDHVVVCVLHIGASAFASVAAAVAPAVATTGGGGGGGGGVFFVVVSYFVVHCSPGAQWA